MKGSTLSHKNRKGFSLLEIIMAVGLLSLVSVYTLQIYVTAHRLNQQTYDLDESIQIANTVMQLVDGSPQDELLLHPVFDQYHVTKSGDGLEIEQWYNENWMPVDHEQDNDNSTAVYHLQVYIEPHQQEVLQQVTVIIDRIKPYLLRQEAHTELYRLSSFRYIPEWEVAGH